mmetsp:Transcript_3674/g.9227  ORF Transcript_3674/g.9227 Transcript_3674/m.9227 type:complete len:252 (+) Transcript_3674:1995-2750(+)
MVGTSGDALFWRFIESRWMKLNEFHARYFCPCTESHCDTITCGDSRIGCGRVQLAGSARGQNSCCTCNESESLASPQACHVGSKANGSLGGCAFSWERRCGRVDQVHSKRMLVYCHVLHRARSLHKSKLHCLPSGILSVDYSCPAMASFHSQMQGGLRLLNRPRLAALFSFFRCFPREIHPEPDELPYQRGSFFYHCFHGLKVIQEGASRHCILYVALKGIRIFTTQHCRNATLSVAGASFCDGTFGHQGH